MLEFSENSSKALHIYATAQPPVVQTGASGRENEFAHSTPMYRDVESSVVCVATRHEAYYRSMHGCNEAQRSQLQLPSTNTGRAGTRESDGVVHTPPERGDEHTAGGHWCGST